MGFQTGTARELVIKLPIFQSKIQEFMLMQTRWASILQPLFGAASNSSAAASGSVVTQDFVFNSGNVTGAGASDLTSFGYGDQGTPILSYNSSTGSNSRTQFQCRFKTPFQATDVLFLEFLIQGNMSIWTDSLNSGAGWTVQSNTFFGGVIVPVSGSTTDVQVWFGNGGFGPEGNVTYGAFPGGLWSNLPGFWRVRRMIFS